MQYGGWNRFNGEDRVQRSEYAGEVIGGGVGADRAGRRARIDLPQLPGLLRRRPGTIAAFSLLYLKESLGWNHAVGFALSVAGSAFVCLGRS
jgi:hypothetical protein